MVKKGLTGLRISDIIMIVREMRAERQRRLITKPLKKSFKKAKKKIDRLVKIC